MVAHSNARPSIGAPSIQTPTKFKKASNPPVYAKYTSAPKGSVPPEPRAAVSLETLVDTIKKNRTDKYNLLLFASSDSTQASRNVSAEEWNYMVTEPLGLVLPQFGTNSHHCVKENGEFQLHGENTGMVNDYVSSVAAVNAFYNELLPVISELFPGGFALTLERGHWRRADPAIDLTLKGKAELKKKAHTDAPEGDVFETFGCNFDIETNPTMTATVDTGRLGVILLNQSKPHSIGQGGATVDKGPVLGWFISPLKPDDFGNYKSATVKEYMRQREKLGKNNKYKAYVWRELLTKGNVVNYRGAKDTNRENVDSITIEANGKVYTLWELIIATTLAYGLPPVVFPSLKRFDVPQSQAAVPFGCFTGIKPLEDRQRYVPSEEVAALGPRVSDTAKRAFTAVADLFGSQNWTLRVSGLDPIYLNKYFEWSI